MVTHNVFTVHCYGMTSRLLADRHAVSLHNRAEKPNRNSLGWTPITFSSVMILKSLQETKGTSALSSLSC